MTKIRYVGAEDGRRSAGPARRGGRRVRTPERERSHTMRRLLAAGTVAVVFLLTLSLMMPVRALKVSGRVLADRAMLKSVADSCFHKRALRIDRSYVRALVLRDPWIEEARILPLPTGVLWVRLREARPVFSLEGGGAISADGRFLPPRRDIDVSGLPRLRAPRREGTTELSKATRQLVRELCVALDRTPWTWPSGLVSVEVGADGDVTLTTGSGLVVVLGSEGWDRRLATFAKTLPLLRPRSGDRLDFRFRRQVVVTSAAGGRNGG